MPHSRERRLSLIVLGGLALALVAHGLPAAASQAQRVDPKVLSQASVLEQPTRVVGEPSGVRGARLPADWQDHGSWAPVVAGRGMPTSQLGLFLGPTAGWVTCQYILSGLSVAGRPISYRCDRTRGSAAGAIVLVAPLVHTATGWWESAATDSGRDRRSFEVFRQAQLTPASNGHPWWITPARARVRLRLPPTVGLRPGDQPVAAGHPAGLTATGSGWPAGSYAVLWNLTNNLDMTPSGSARCTAPGCQWMVPSNPSGSYRFTVYLHAESGARIDADAARPGGTATVTWGPDAQPAPAPTVGIRPAVQQEPAGHPAGLTVTGSGWPIGAYAELWDLTDNTDTTPTRSDQCTAPECQWMVPAHPAGTYRFAVYLHAASGARITSSTQPARVTWVGSSPAPPGPPTATPTPTPVATPTPTSTPTPVATPTPTPTPTPPTTPAPGPTQAPGGVATLYDSQNWSGYGVQPGPYTYVTGTFTVPSLHATPGVSAVATWVGIDGWSPDSSLIQAGVQETYNPSVSTTTFDLYPWWEILPAPETPIDSMTVSVGDQITVTIDQVSGAMWGISITDVSTGASFTTDQAYSAPLSSAEWIVEAPTNSSTHQIDTLSPYSPQVTFTSLRMSGSEATLDEVVMDQNGVQVSTPSPLSSAGFAVAYGPIAPAGP